MRSAPASSCFQLARVSLISFSSAACNTQGGSLQNVFTLSGAQASSSQEREEESHGVRGKDAIDGNERQHHMRQVEHDCFTSAHAQPSRIVGPLQVHVLPF